MSAKYVNEIFFDVEGKSPDELKKTWYIVGISFSQYSPKLVSTRQASNRWQSTYEPLIEIVKSALESKHVISPTKNRHIRTGEDFITYWLMIRNQKIYDALSNTGLNLPKKERAFPPIEEQYLDHFVRGFFDAHVSCQNYIVKYKSKYNQREFSYQRIRIFFNVPFLNGLYNALVQYANVKAVREIIKSPLEFKTADTRAIYHFIYRDWDFIQENGLYLPSKKELYDKHTPDELFRRRDYSISPSKIAAQNRIAEAKELLRRGMTNAQVAKQLGYSNVSALSRAFKRQSGGTIGQFLRQSALVT